MKPSYGVIRSQQIIKTQRQQAQRQFNQNRGAGIQNYYQTLAQNQRERMIKTGTCLQCQGTGSRFIFFTCSACNGTGHVNHCQACNGKGRGLIFKCKTCHGTGKIA